MPFQQGHPEECGDLFGGQPRGTCDSSLAPNPVYQLPAAQAALPCTFYSLPLPCPLEDSLSRQCLSFPSCVPCLNVELDNPLAGRRGTCGLPLVRSTPQHCSLTQRLEPEPLQGASRVRGASRLHASFRCDPGYERNLHIRLDGIRVVELVWLACPWPGQSQALASADPAGEPPPLGEAAMGSGLTKRWPR